MHEREEVELVRAGDGKPEPYWIEDGEKVNYGADAFVEYQLHESKLVIVMPVA